MFGNVDYDPSSAYPSAPVEEQLEALGAAVAAGKVRHVGLSNETPYGLARFCAAAAAAAAAGPAGGAPRGLARVVSLQNAYSLTCRGFDAGLAECCHAERVSLLAYSPLAMGLLTGKYLAPDGGPPGARRVGRRPPAWSRMKKRRSSDMKFASWCCRRLNRYRGRYAEAESRYGPRPNVRAAVEAYVAIASRWGVAPAELALRFVLSHPLVAAAVAGASSARQLEALLAAAAAPPLEAALRQEVDAVHAAYPNPTP
jgi:N-acetyltransferase 10